MDFAPVLDHLFGANPTPERIDSLELWWAGHQRAVLGMSSASHLASPIEGAIRAGFAADRPAYVFASALQEALAELLGRPADRRRALCATEQGGAHPRSILTTLSPDPEGGWCLDGEKRWSTLGGFAEELLVVARLPAELGDQRPRLCVVCIPASRLGVQLQEMPAMAFIPEVPHAVATFESVHVTAEERLPGDGYDRYLKPFRTVEDCFVHAAMLAWLIRIGRHASWPNEHVEALAAALAGFAALSFADPSSAAVHRTLGGLLVRVHQLIDASEEFCPLLDPETRHCWARDRPLFSVAAGARARRLQAARRRTSAMPAGSLA